MKRILTVLIALLVLLCTGASAENSGLTAGEYHFNKHAEIPTEKAGNFEYIILADGTAEIVNYTGHDFFLMIPGEFNGYTVTSIGQQAFFWCNSFSVAIIPESVAFIGDRAFNSCDSLTVITIPEGVTSIGEYAFSNCKSLATVNLPDSLVTIGDYAFNQCASLTSMTIPEGVTSIGEYAFYSCSSLTSMTIPGSVASIGEYALAYCADAVFTVDAGSVAERYILDHNGTFIARTEGFWTCSECLNYTNRDTCTVCSPEAQATADVPAYSWTFYRPAAGTFDRSSNAFSPLQRYGNYWYIILDDDTVEIQRYSGTEAHLNIPARINGVPVTSIGYDAFLENDFLISVTVPDGVTTLANGAFEKCTSMTSITLPDSVVTIAGNAFHSCKSLSTMTIPDGVTQISYNTFWGCESLTHITLPDSITEIGDSAFTNCKSLTSFHIPRGVSRLYRSSFTWCTALTDVHIPETVTYIGRTVFSSLPNLVLHVVPGSYGEEYALEYGIPFVYEP